MSRSSGNVCVTCSWRNGVTSTPIQFNPKRLVSSINSKSHLRFSRLSLPWGFSTAEAMAAAAAEEEEEMDLEYVVTDRKRGFDELEVAVRAVQMACFLCQRVQEKLLVAKESDQLQSKVDNSPITVADWSVQAVISWILSKCFGSDNVSIVAEEGYSESKRG
ncbi:unnamed protein product [Rhodiola kirilowii]